MSLIQRVITLPFALLVFVASSASAQVASPVKIANAEDAVQVSFLASLANGDVFGSSNTYTVPAGQRLVIEDVSGLARMLEGQRPAEVGFSTTVNGVIGDHSLLLVEQSSGGLTFHTFVVNHVVHIYADPGTTVRFGFLRNSATGSAAFFATLSGYLVPMP